jgi:hypothetical protein
MISAEELFIRRFDDLRVGLQARDDFDLLKVGAILRQLLVDEHPLVHQANTATRLKLRFRVNASRLRADDLQVETMIHLMGLGLDSTAFVTSGDVEEMNIDQFLKVVMISGDDRNVTVLDVIKHAANKAGGIHFSGGSGASDSVDFFLAKLSTVGVHALAVTLQTIARMTLWT